jgi:hypothetical protein
MWFWSKTCNLTSYGRGAVPEQGQYLSGFQPQKVGKSTGDVIRHAARNKDLIKTYQKYSTASRTQNLS